LKKKTTTTSQTVYIERNTNLMQVEETKKSDIPHDKALSIAAVSEIIMKNNHGQELALKRPDSLALSNKKYKEICVPGSSALANVTQGAMPVLSQAKTISEITKAAPNGLFTATAPITDLMKYKDGTVGSILVRDGIAGHLGFKEVALSVANPAAVVGAGMQAMAAVSGQYYMHQITTQLKGIDKKLDKLVGFHHDEKIGILKSVNKGVIDLTTKINVDAADIISIQRQKEKAEAVYFEYMTRFEGIDINDIIGVKKRWLNKTKEIRNLNENLDENELDFTVQMCYHASVLVEKCTLTEIAIRMKMSGQEAVIEELCAKLKSEYDERFHRCTEKHINNKYLPILEKAAGIGAVTEKRLNTPRIILPFGVHAFVTTAVIDVVKNAALNKQTEGNEKEIETLELRQTELLEMTTANSQIVEEVVSFFENPREILYLPNEETGEQRIFVEVNSEETNDSENFEI